jgi:predicted dehydrogenase
MGCAAIAQKQIRAMKLSASAKIVAVASRNIEKVKAYALTNDLAADVALYASYEELLIDPNVDAIYAPLPTRTHIVWALKIAAAKKHLLIEKPAAINAVELGAIIKACRDNGVLFMDGVMFMHHDRLEVLRSALRDPLVGPVCTLQRRITHPSE